MRRLTGVRNREIGAAAAALAAVAATALAVAMARERVGREGPATDRPAQVPADGYTSSSACRACHPAEHASWHASFHRTMTQIATPETSAARFDNVTVADVVGEPMHLEIRGQQLWAEFDDPDRVGVGVGVGTGVRPWSDRGQATIRSRSGQGQTLVRPRIQRRVVMTT